MEATRIAETHPEVAYHTAHMHTAQQHAAEMRAGRRPYLSPSAFYPDVPQFKQGAIRYAEENPDIVNRYASCGRACGDTSETFCERCRLGAEVPHSFYHPSEYHYPTVRAPYFDNQSRAPQGSIGGPQPLCSACLTESIRAVRDIPPYRGPVLMGTTCAPGRDRYLHHENCPQAQAEQYCRCRDCDDRRRGLLGSPAGSYERARANSAREV
jgi:hypothetical protein